MKDKECKMKSENKKCKMKKIRFHVHEIEKKKYVHSHFMVYCPDDISKWHQTPFSYHSVKLSNLSLTV